MTENDLSCGVEFLIGIVHITDLIYKPGIAVGVWVLHRNGLTTLQRHDHISGVQHIQYRIDAVAIHLRHVTGSLGDSREHRPHLRFDIRVDQLLVTTQFGSMVTADTLMVIRCLVLIKCIRCQVQHAVVATIRRILQDKVIRLGLGLRCVTLCLVYEHRIIQITFVHHPHIQQTHHQQDTHQVLALDLVVTIQQQEECSDGDQEE